MNTKFKIKTKLISLILILMTFGCASQSKIYTEEKTDNSPVNNNVELDVKNAEVKRYPPTYPSEAARQGIEG
ncbi:hypothetical protein Sps_05257 [Shewanella psychrophila]|uniref:TonB C-terminal domain-containing protein n=1 Tax=Shewanella psychrophila TaxID=225848 RepID=A0A1S6HXL3_9GAMM|nr:hypothetical protein [Shewanella psychrophila]AQS40326.1 hypothetical protein Sps_05257 [Shewanella psychrophila]